MRIILVSINSPFDDDFRSIGGAEWSLRLLGSHLSKSGHEVHYITRGRPFTPKEIISGIQAHRSWMPYIPLLHRLFSRVIILNSRIMVWSLRWKISRMLKRHSIDVMISYSPSPAGYSIVKETEGKKVVRIQRIGGKFWERIRNRPGNDHDSMITSFKGTDLFISNCHYLADEFRRFHRKQMGYEPRMVVQEIGQEIPQKSDIKPDPKILVSVGSLKDYQKRQDILIRALHILRKRGRDLDLVLVGDGPNRGPLESLTKELGIVEHVLFRGFLSMDRAREETSKGLIYLHASEWEGVSKAILDAMLLERPIVASDVGGIDEYIINGSTGILSRNDPGSFADAVERLLDDPSLARGLGVKARELAIDRYDPKKNLSAYERLFAQEMRRKSRSMRSR